METHAVHLDFSKAFDKVSHKLLLHKLRSYGFSGSLLKWFNNYLTNRTQRVVIDGVILIGFLYLQEFPKDPY
jgi:hypothetical protein